MAQPPQTGAEFVRRIVTDPKSVPDVMQLYGYAGASSEEGHERLYLSPDLANYVEIPGSAILHRAAVPAEQDPNGAVTLWVKRDAKLVHKMAPSAQAQALAHYFAGAIQATAGGIGAPMAAAYGAGGGGVAAPPLPPSPLDGCQPPSLPQALCPRTPNFGCTPGVLCGHTPVIPCATHPPQATCAPLCTHVTCNVVLCHTPVVPCVTHPPASCATCIIACGHTPVIPCVTQPPQATCALACTHNIACNRTPVACTLPAACPTLPQALCPPFSANCAAQAPAAFMPSLDCSHACSYAPGCYYSWEACQTLHYPCVHTPHCPP